MIFIEDIKNAVCLTHSEESDGAFGFDNVFYDRNGPIELQV